MVDIRQSKRSFDLRRDRNLQLVIVLAVALIAGMLIASRIRLRPTSTTTPLASGQLLIITDIVVGTPLSEAERKQANPRLQQKAAYEAGEPLALRVTTDPAITRQIELSVRLVTKSGSIVELDPASIELPAGTSTFCCWQVNQPGTYTMQVFRPERTITSIPLTIKKPLQTPPSANFKLLQ